MRRAACVAITAAALIGFAPGSSTAAPVRGNNTFEPIYVCGDALLVFITPSTGANTGWQVDASGDTADTPFHLKWYSLRIYDGVLDTEPATSPLFAIEKSFGIRVGQGEPVRCTGQHSEAGPDGSSITVFLDVDLVRL